MSPSRLHSTPLSHHKRNRRHRNTSRHDSYHISSRTHLTQQERWYQSFHCKISQGSVWKGIHMSVKTMDELLLDELKDLYSAEKQLTKALPKMARAAASQDLKAAFENHLEETQGHV